LELLLSFEGGSLLEYFMTEETSHEQKGQIERAQRIRQQIDRLKSGSSQDDRPDEDKSLREQIEERAKQVKKPA
jgi:hypothetical protein